MNVNCQKCGHIIDVSESKYKPQVTTNNSIENQLHNVIKQGEADITTSKKAYNDSIKQLNIAVVANIQEP